MNRLLTIILLAIPFCCFGQFEHEPIFPQLQDDELREALVDNYKTSTVLTYSEARDTFMRNFDAINNVLECVYTGYKVTLDPNEDPTTNAFSQGINTEHTYPRSKGALEGTNAYSDMHHLFPTRERVNSDRGSLIMADVNDSATDKWYFEENIQTNIPTVNRDAYSELLTNEGFEPRESHKGDVARACFYFYTMYKAQADNAAPNFFELQRETLCDWHFQDAVDEKEWNRNNMIARYQDDKKNPFILDCRLARLYCADIEGYCTTVSSADTQTSTLKTYPNPTHAELSVFLSSNLFPSSYEVLDFSGRVVASGRAAVEGDVLQVDVSNIQSGMYLVRLLDDNKGSVASARFIKI